MGIMKDFDIRIRNGGDDAIAAVEEYVAEQERLIAQVESMLQRACDRQWKEWVPVTEQMPADGLYLIAWDGREQVTIGHLVDGEWFDPVVAISEYGPPTHWMTMPYAPRPAPPMDAK